MQENRRKFLKKIGRGAAGLAAAPLLYPAAVPETKASSTGVSSPLGKYGLELDQKPAGWLISAEGGEATSDVVVEKPTPDLLVKKHLAGLKYEEISVACGTGMTAQFYQWVKASFDRKYTRHDGAIVAADFSFREVARRKFIQALVTEIGMPALDAASKDAAKMSVKFSPETTRRVEGSGAQLPSPRQKFPAWNAANFRLRIDGLEEPCARVNKIEALVFKQKLNPPPSGDTRDYEQEATSVEIPNLVITFPESHAKPFYDWLEDFVVKGNNGDDREKGGTLEYLTPNLNEALFALTFHNLGIFKLTAEKAESNSDNIRRVKAEMYCESIEFDYSAAATWA